jgi:hypothetical protein
MKHILNILSIVFICTFFWACEEPFSPKIDYTEQFLVVESQLSDKPQRLKLKLSRSIPFDDRTHFEAERNAGVWLWDAFNNYTQLIEQSPGDYITRDTLYPAAGEEYFIHIITQDDEQYYSERVKIPDPVAIDTVAFIDSTKREINHNYYGEPFVRDFGGFYASVLPSVPQNNDVGFLYNWGAVVNYRVTCEEMGMTFTYYCWKKLYSNTLYIYDYNRGNTNNAIIFDDIHFISDYDISPLPIDSSRFDLPITQAIPTTFYYRIEQHTISADAADFFREIENQSKAGGKLFDPLEQEIGTNINCYTDPSKKAYGYFYAASSQTRVFLVDLTVNKITNITEVDTMPAPDVIETCLDTIPNFWYYSF